MFNQSEAPELHEFFVYLVENYLEMIAGDQGENMGKLLASCIKIFESESSNAQLDQRIKRILSKYYQIEELQQTWKELLEGINEEYKTKLQKCIVA